MHDGMHFDDTHFACQFRKITQATPERIFTRFEGTPISFGRLDAMSDALAADLVRKGIKRGDHVAVMLNNGIPAVAAILALSKAGFVWVPINVRLRGDGLRYLLEHSEARALIIENDLLDFIKLSGASLENLICLVSDKQGSDPDGVESILERHEAFESVENDPRSLMGILYTSGTTGRAKGVLFSHQMLITAGQGAYLVSTPKPGDIFFLWEPLYHVAGVQNLVLPLLENVELAMVEKFSASRFWQQASEAKATHIHPIGGVLQILLKQAPGPFDRAHNVRVSWGGAGASDNLKTFRDRFGVEVRPCYGMTEASSITTRNINQTPKSIGQILPWFSVAIKNEEGETLPSGAVGEIVVTTSRPGAIFKGYFKNLTATESALKADGLHTGDKGWLDKDGNLYFAGRLTDNFRCRGENVSAWEVEHVVLEHPAVQACALVGITADIGEQELMLFVQRKPEQKLVPDELSAWLNDKLATYQNPRYIKFAETFERTPSQRIIKGNLDKSLLGAWDRQSASKGAKQSTIDSGA